MAARKKPAPKRRRVSDSLLALGSVRNDTAITPHRTQLRLPDLPPNVLPEGKRLAMDDATTTLNNWSNGITGWGCGLYFPGYQYLAELAQRPEYRSPIETIAEEMTRKWVKLTSTGGKAADKIQKIEARFKELNVQDLFRRVTELDGYFGMGHLFVKLKGDNAKREDPLIIAPETVRQGTLQGFKTIEPMWTTPVAWNSTDPTEPDFYRPNMWYVLGKPTHATRMLTFVSREVPDLLKPSYNFGGLSLSQMLESYVNDWLRTKKSVADLIRNFSIIALSMDMESALSGGEGSEHFNRLRLFVQDRDNRGVMTLNKDTEELNQIAVPLSSLPELQAQSQEHMSAISHLPLSKAFGITPTGLNASTEDELLMFDDHIHARQEIQYTKPYRAVLELVQLDLFGEVDDRIVYEYEPLRELDGEALGRVRKGDAEMAGVLIQNGVISPEEERARLARDPNSGYDDLVPADVPDPADIPGQQTEEGEGKDDLDEAA